MSTYLPTYLPVCLRSVSIYAYLPNKQTNCPTCCHVKCFLFYKPNITNISFSQENPLFSENWHRTFWQMSTFCKESALSTVINHLHCAMIELAGSSETPVYKTTRQSTPEDSSLHRQGPENATARSLNSQMSCACYDRQSQVNTQRIPFSSPTEKLTVLKLY